MESWEVEMEGEAPYRTVDGPRELYHRLLAHGMLSEGYRLAGEAMIAFGTTP